jgi:hypothetical protein
MVLDDYTIVLRISEPNDVIALLPANIEPDLPACEEVWASWTPSFHPNREL